MALRSGTQHVDRWPEVATASALWNVSGSPNTTAFLEPGDRCYVTGVGVYQCVTAAIGSATWMLLSSGGLPEPIAGWNGIDMTQFTASGSADWTTDVGAFGFDGVVAARFTATVAAGTKDRTLVFDPGLVLPAAYTVDAYVGPYTGNNNALQRVQAKPIAHYVDATHFLGAAPQGDNTGGSSALNVQSMIANGGAAGYATILTSVMPFNEFPVGLMRFHVMKTSSRVIASCRPWAGSARISAAYTTGASDKVGFLVSHFGQSQAIGDSSYFYGLQIYEGLVG